MRFTHSISSYGSNESEWFIHDKKQIMFVCLKTVKCTSSECEKNWFIGWGDKGYVLGL